MSENAFITVPETTLLNGTVVPAFEVGQYLCSQGEDGKAAVNATGKPWVRINYHDARKACEAAGFKLITELQALAIAHDIANVAINWTSGVIGEGKLFQGLRKWNVSEAQAGDYVSEDADERRWFELSNGQRITDAAGNAFTWVYDNVQGDENGITCKPFAENSLSITTAPFPSMDRGVGWYPSAGADWSRSALVRGGYWVDEDGAGVFGLRNDWPGDDGYHVGFRCTK